MSRNSEDKSAITASMMQSLVNALASTSLDTKIASKRVEAVQQAERHVEQPHSVELLASLEGVECRSDHAVRRVARLYCRALLASENEDETVILQLCRGLCRVLIQGSIDHGVGILETCVVKRLLSVFNENETAKRTKLLNAWEQIATEEDDSSYYAPALALASALDDTKTGKEDPNKWIEILLQRAFRGTNMAVPNDIRFCTTMLWNHATQSDWELIEATCTLKLRASPERALELVAFLVAALRPCHLTIVDRLESDWMPTLLKQLKSPKSHIRKSTHHLLTSLALLQQPEATAIVSKALGSAVSSLSQADQREGVYQVLGNAAERTSRTLDTDTLSAVLSNLTTALGKETKVTRDAGLRALSMWMVAATRSGDGGEGYDQAVNYLQAPLEHSNGAETVWCIGTLVTIVHPDVLESITLNLWGAATAKKLDKGIQGIVESASKKHASSSTVPPVEGLVATYLVLVHSLASGKKVLDMPACVVKALSAGASSLNKTSFLYSQTMTDAVISNRLVGQLLPRTIALYAKLLAREEKTFSKLFDEGTAAARALACCITHPCALQQSSPTEAILSSMQTVLTYFPAAGDSLVSALVEHVNILTLEYEQHTGGQNATREDREVFMPINELSSNRMSVKGQYCPTASHQNIDPNAVRQSGVLLAKCAKDASRLAEACLLLHVGSSLKTTGKQRRRLVENLTDILEAIVLPWATGEQDVLSAMVNTISEFACWVQRHSANSVTPGVQISKAVHKSALSFMSSLGGIACSFDPAFDDPADEDMKTAVFSRKLCTEGLATAFARSLTETLSKVEALSERDVAVYRSRMGSLFQEVSETLTDNESKATAVQGKTGGKSRRGKGDFGAGVEEEEWEREIKKELAQKKKSSGLSASSSLTTEEMKLVATQDIERRRICGIVDGDLTRTFSSIQNLFLSDIEVGNASLPVLSSSVLKSALSECAVYIGIPALKARAVEILSTLASGVYEIDESHAPSLARALTICCRRTVASNQLEVVALPSPCEPAAVAVSEMDKFSDCLSGPSFSFLFPILRAALAGPRTVPGCEAALRVLNRHTRMIDGDEENPCISLLRKDMAVSVLDLLSHDRSQTFIDPSPTETLVNCYQTGSLEKPNRSPALSTSEIAPLLDERGALGVRQCRVASMIVIRSIAEKRLSLAKNNPLIENRVWVNCFDEHESVHHAARSAWMVITGNAGGAEDIKSLPSPSPLYAIPLLPLLSHSDSSVAVAAADAFAHAMGRHLSSADGSVSKLCGTFIEAYPTEFAEEKTISSLPAPLPRKALPTPAAKKKTIASISTGLPKKVVKKKSALAVAGIGQAKPRATKKKAVSSALLKPKEKRSLNKDFFESQFRTDKKPESSETDSLKKVEIRLGVLKAIASLTETSAAVDLDLSSLRLLVGFLVAYGLADGNDNVREAARNDLREIVASNGGSDEAIAYLLPLFESVLNTGVADESSLGKLETSKVPRNVAASDRRKEGVVVALGSVALHLKGAESESKIDNTIDMLLGALKTPSESVQSSVAASLAKLMKKGHTQDRIEVIISSLMKDCIHGDSLATRRGAAYGISAAVKGSGIASLKKYEVVKQLEQSCSSGASNEKEGALFAIELLSGRLGLLFEPYVIVLLPSLLKSSSDSSDYVRTAADNTVGIIMSKLSAHGVKLILPAVLSAFEDPAWRTKQASIHMLGSMSHLAPKQLASALPKVVPKLTEAFSDTHPKVKASAEDALGEISKVIKNPEVSSISPALLKALTDPAEYTVKGLEALIGTEFLHAIDAPSLALIVPVLHRGLRDRAATTKRYSALIAGNICTMINDPRDFVPYLPILIPDLKSAVLDPIPDVRSTSAKALGSLTRGLGEETLVDLRPWLVAKLREDSLSSAERSGAAQGLTEVLLACGTSVVESVMLDEILPLRNHPQASTREGVLWVLTFLPSALGQAFAPLIDASLPALLGGLSDDSELVRDVAMRAGRVLVRSHGKVHVDKVLPSLENGLADDDYRIRVASLTLLGDLLSMIGGTSVVKGDGETQDDIRRAERAQAQIALVLGSETRKRVLSELYMTRSDTAAVVRQSAVQVWKTVVSVTARALRDILQVLVSKIVDALASGHPEKTQVAGRCLGDVVNKLGDSVLPEIIPVLRNALYTGDQHTRTGVCVGLSEVIRCSSKDQILRFLEIIVKVVQDALCDEDEGVRKMAASCFQSLHSLVGNKAMDEIVPSLLVALEQTDDEQSRTRALNGLTGILSIRSRELLPYIIPKLIRSPITTNHAEALSGIAAVTGGTIHMHFSSIIPGLLMELAGFLVDEEDKEEKSREAAVRECARSVCRHVDDVGVNWLISQITSKCSSDKSELRETSCWMFQIAMEERSSKQDFYEEVPIILRELLYRLNDENPSVVKAAHSAFSALSKNVPAEELVKHIEFIRNLIASIVSEARHRKGGVGSGEFLLPGFNMPKGLEPFLPIYQRGILFGNATVREVAAAGLGELISLTSSKYLAGPLIIKITGPLLRIVGDRNPSDVKIAILRTLGLILVKGGPALRAFVPQFQTTFVKALADPSRQVRVEAIQALALLMPLSTRVDPLLKELVSGSLGKSGGGMGETAAIAAVQTATLEALAVVLRKGGAKAKLPASVPSALDAGKELLRHEDEGIREAAAKVLGAACELLGVETAMDVLQTDVLGQSDSSSEIRHGKACACHRIAASSVGSNIGESGILSDLISLIVSYMKDDKGIVRQAACVAIGALVSCSTDADGALRQVEPDVLPILQNSKESFEVHRSMSQGLCLAMHLYKTDNRVSFLGKTLMDASLQLAMSGSQRVQHAYNDVLWMALNVQEGEQGLEQYTSMASFDKSKSMKSLYSKVLSKIKEVELD